MSRSSSGENVPFFGVQMLPSLYVSGLLQLASTCYGCVQQKAEHLALQLQQNKTVMPTHMLPSGFFFFFFYESPHVLENLVQQAHSEEPAYESC